LPSNAVESILRDSHGFLWLATREGLARFDGYDFVTYTKADGLPRNAVASFMETRAGIYWAATSGGVARFEPSGRGNHKFTIFAPQDAESRRIYVIYEDRAGGLWCGTHGGLYRMRVEGAGFRFEAVPMILASGKPAGRRPVLSIFEDSRGDLWIGTRGGLVRLERGGGISEYHVGNGGDENWHQVLEDRSGGLWAATGFGLWRLETDRHGGYLLRPVFVPKRRVIVYEMLQDSAGTLWLATTGGLVECRGGGEACAQEPRIYSESNGLTYPEISAIAADREGNLWLGTPAGGAMRLARNGVVTYTPADGLDFGKHDSWPALFRDHIGRVHVAFANVLQFLRGDRFSSVVPVTPQRIKYFGWGWHQRIVQDHDGEWWIATGQGLLRYPAVAMEALSRTVPKAIYTVRDGLGTDDVFRIFEDSRGDVWVAGIGLTANGLVRWDRKTNTFVRQPLHDSSAAVAFAEDRTGVVWAGYFDGVLGRFRGGTMTSYTADDGLAGGGMTALAVDHGGRLWIGSLGGVTRVDDPAADRPRFQRFGTQQGLSSNLIYCMEEDRAGRMYLATGRGIDQINADGGIAPGRVRHFTQSDGLASGEVRDILFDREGLLWYATSRGITRFAPERATISSPAPAIIRNLRMRGVPVPLWELGAPLVRGLIFAPDQNQLLIDFAAQAFATGDPPQYQYRLDPADADWSSPSAQHVVNYANVAPGRYRFRARVAGESASASEAVLEFRVLAPLWARWWFQLGMLMAVLGILHWLHRYRTARLLEVERVRARIATDLHDDIGSGLSQIAVLTETARAGMNGYGGELNTALADIAAVSRELAESMNDIVWSIHPHKDRAIDLVRRMRRFASDVLTGSHIDFTFEAGAGGEGARIPPELRREVYLIFKEAVNNLVRHACATRAEIRISIASGRLELRVEDNGRGARGKPDEDGHGLRSMRDRARRIGGEIEFMQGDCGFGVILHTPLRAPSRAATHTGGARGGRSSVY
jgi:ligand-binding sensor domain-containing protein/two-component sensor histidine kinase